MQVAGEVNTLDGDVGKGVDTHQHGPKTTSGGGATPAAGGGANKAEVVGGGEQGTSGQHKAKAAGAVVQVQAKGILLRGRSASGPPELGSSTPGLGSPDRTTVPPTHPTPATTVPPPPILSPIAAPGALRTGLHTPDHTSVSSGIIYRGPHLSLRGTNEERKLLQQDSANRIEVAARSLHLLCRTAPDSQLSFNPLKYFEVGRPQIAGDKVPLSPMAIHLSKDSSTCFRLLPERPFLDPPPVDEFRTAPFMRGSTNFFLGTSPASGALPAPSNTANIKPEQLTQCMEILQHRFQSRKEFLKPSASLSRAEQKEIAEMEGSLAKMLVMMKDHFAEKTKKERGYRVGYVREMRAALENPNTWRENVEEKREKWGGGGGAKGSEK